MTKDKKLIVGAGGGGGGGGGGQTVVQQTIVAPTRTPVRDADNLSSKQYAKILDLLGEGEIEGFPSARAYTRDTADYNKALLKDIYFNNTPILRSGADVTNLQDTDYNFINMTVTPRYGTQNQSYISGFEDIEEELSVNQQVKKVASVTKQITDTNVDAIRVTLTVPRLEQYTDEGDVKGSSISLSIQLQYDGAGFNTVKTDTITGRTADQFQRDYIVDIDGAFPVDVRVVRNTDDSTDTNLLNDLYWTSYTEIIYQKLSYPNSVVIGHRFDSSQFGSIPKRSYRIRGKKVKIPNNGTVDQDNGRIVYSGTWNGTFGAAQWTSDPAWILYDLLISKRFGFGDHISESQLDKFAFYSCSQYASALIDDGFGGKEPRFSANVLIQNQDEAFKLINDLCSTMRVMPYWSNGTLTLAQDKPGDPTYLFTLANVKEEGFSYSASSLKVRHTAAVVSYLDLETQDLNYESVENASAIAKYGYIPAEIKAFACTSRGQAHRLGEWLLYSEYNEKTTCTFTTSMEGGVVVRPGQIIQISDPMKSGSRRAGRIITATTSSVTLDNVEGLPTKNGTFYIVTPSGTIESQTIANRIGTIVYPDNNFSVAPNANSMWMWETTDLQPTLWRVISIEESEPTEYKVTALEHNPSKYDYIERGVTLQQRDVTNLNLVPSPPSSLSAQEILYESNGRANVKIKVSWPTVAGSSNYRIRWRPENGNWTTETISRNDYEVLDTGIGKYYFEVYSLSGTFIPSSSFTSLTFNAAGKTTPPVNVSGVSLIPSDSTSGQLSWTLAPDLDVKLGGKVLIRHSLATSGALWEESQEIVSAAAGNQTQKLVPLLEGTYLLKFEDDTGNRSTSATSVIVDFPEPLQPRSLIQEFREDQEIPPFQGNRTNMFYSAEFDGLILDSGLNVDSMATDNNWDGLASIDSVGGVVPSGEYEFGTTFDAGGVYDVNLFRRFVTRPYVPGSLWDDKTELIDSWSGEIDEAGLDAVNAVMYVRTTSDDPAGTPVWGTWNTFSNAIVRGRGFQFKTKATSSDAAVNIVIDELGAELRLQQRAATGSGITGASASGVVYENRFYEPPNVGITAFNMSTGDYPLVSNVTRSGFTLEFRNSAGSSVGRQFTYQAIGFGREI